MGLEGPRRPAAIRLERWLKGDGWAMRAVRGLAERTLGIDRLNALHRSVAVPGRPEDFFANALAALEVRLDVAAGSLAAIPASGPCVVVANHPFGMVEGIALGALVARIRPDFRFLGNFMLDAIPEIAPFNLPVDPFGVAGSAGRNAPVLRSAYRWLEGGGVLLLFPSGEVASFDSRRREVAERPWQPHLARLMRRSGATVVPVHFAGTNSATFHWLGRIHPLLRTARLPEELLNKRGRTLPVTVGTALDPAWILAQGPDAAIMENLRQRTCALGSASGATGTRDRTAAPKPIAEAEPADRVAEEVAALPADCLLCENRDFQVFCAAAERIPSTLREIGRQREITFRRVGEGTGEAIDLDAFDAYYDHLFVWHREAREIVGAYRLVAVDEVVRDRGIAGLYTSTLFEYDHTLIARVGPMLELGRSFVRAEYQRTFAALHLLWRGIGQYVARRPQYRYLLGAVSISDEYTTSSQQLLTSFLQDNCFAAALSDCVAPRNPVDFRPGDAARAQAPVTDLEALAGRILELESGRRGFPILLRQYLKLGGSILGLNRDPRFANVIDGLIVVDLLRAPERVVERYLGAEGLAAVRAQNADPHRGAAS